MNKKNKQQLKYNIIKFIVGLILLLLAFGYLQNHPAEKSSRNTGSRILLQKMGQSVQKLVGNYDPLQEQKQHMINSYDEIIYVSQSTSCFDELMTTELNNTFQELHKGTLDHFKTYREQYAKVRKQYEDHLQTECVNITLENRPDNQ